MSQITQQLPAPLSANITYQAILIDGASYDPLARQYVARVFGVCKGRPLPLIICNRSGVQHVDQVVITDAEIDGTLEARPELNGDRVAGAIARAFDRLYTLARE